MAASQGYEEAYDRQEKDHSIFTYYLLEGLKGHKNAVDDEGDVTYDTLGNFIAREIGNLPPEKRPKQTPVRKGEVAGGGIVLANYPELRKDDISKLITQGIWYMERNDYSNAIECFNKVLLLEPQYYVIWYKQAESYFNLDEFDKAIECYDKCIELDPGNEDAKRKKNFAIEKAKQKGKKEGKDVETPSNTTHDNISTIDESSEYSTYNLIQKYIEEGKMYRDIGSYSDAIYSFDKALQINRDHPNACKIKGDILLYDLGRSEEAITYYNRILDKRSNAIQVLKDKATALEKLSRCCTY